MGEAMQPSEERRQAALQLLEQRKRLPIWSARKRLVALAQQYSTVILVGETGSGKTTQVPQIIAQRANIKGRVVCTQPRRVAAITVAQRVCAEQGCNVGQAVGYRVRFDDCTSAESRIIYMTDGMLMRDAVLDPMLRSYGVVFVDEAHERTVNTDLLLGLLKRAQRLRQPTSNPLKLFIMSATLDFAGFVDFFPDSVLGYVQGRLHPVELFYTVSAQESYLQSTINAIMQIHCDEPRGVILAFLTGQDEIEHARRVLTDTAPDTMQHPLRLAMHVVAIYAALPPDEQAAVFESAPESARKVVLATNIAETSVTIPGVRYVVDCGMVKARAHSAQRCMESLQVIPTSQAQARQRAGRAGRDGPGKCFRLYPEAAYHSLPEVTVPEVQRVNLASAVLQLKAVGVDDILGFDFLDPPPRAALVSALELLFALQAMDSNGALTTLGRDMARLPLEPPAAAVLLAARRLECEGEALAVVSMLSADRVFLQPSGRELEAAERHQSMQSALGDHVTLLNVFQQYMATPVKKRGRWCHSNFLSPKALRVAGDVFVQLQEQMQRRGLGISGKASACPLSVEGSIANSGEQEALRQALVMGLFRNAARRQPDGTLRMLASGQTVSIHPSSVLMGQKMKPECVVFEEVILTNRPYARTVTIIDPAWLPALVPRFFASVGDMKA